MQQHTTTQLLSYFTNKSRLCSALQVANLIFSAPLPTVNVSIELNAAPVNISQQQRLSLEFADAMVVYTMQHTVLYLLSFNAKQNG